MATPDRADSNAGRHTLGPWTAEREPNAPSQWRVTDDDGMVIADVWGFAAPDREGQEEANACLIAAAPKLLHALRIIKGACELSIAGNGPGGLVRAMTLLVTCDEAIAQAGVQP